MMMTFIKTVQNTSKADHYEIYFIYILCQLYDFMSLEKLNAS